MEPHAIRFRRVTLTGFNTSQVETGVPILFRVAAAGAQVEGVDVRDNAFGPISVAQGQRVYFQGGVMHLP